MAQTVLNPEKEPLASRVSLFLALLMLNSVVYQFAMYMSFFEGMDALGTGLIAIYVAFTLCAMYQRRLSLMSIVAQIALSAAFFSLNTDFVLAAEVPLGVVYIKKYITLLLAASQFLAPMRFISRRGYLAALWCVAGLFVLYVLASLGAGIVEQESAIRAGGYAALGERVLGPERWWIIFRQSCITAGILIGMIVLSFSPRGDWPADRKRAAKAARAIAKLE
jgi:hypothetical protein